MSAVIHKSSRNALQHCVSSQNICKSVFVWKVYSPRNDPDPEMIPTFLLVDREMIPKELGKVIKHGTVEYSIITESKAILANVVN